MEKGKCGSSRVAVFWIRLGNTMFTKHELSVVNNAICKLTNNRYMFSIRDDILVAPGFPYGIRKYRDTELVPYVYAPLVILDDSNSNNYIEYFASNSLASAVANIFEWYTNDLIRDIIGNISKENN